MGDRANFGIKHRDGNIIFVYGHWAGDGMLARFANALKRVEDAGRIGDEPYGTRIIISELIGDSWKSNTGWGITINTLSDNEHKVPVYDIDTDIVSLYDFDWNSNTLTDKIVEFASQDFIRKYAKTMVGV
jgi:hypothetical protein